MAEKKTCLECGNGFIGRSDASTCSPACRKRAQRRRKGDKCDTAVTDRMLKGRTSDATPRRSKAKSDRSVVTTVPESDAETREHTAEALSVLAELDAELADSSAEFEQKYGDPLDYSAADRAVREMVACEIDRKVWLLAAYDRAGDDVALRVKLATELRLTEQSVARLLRQINTGPPPEPLSQKSKKAQRAAYVKWGRESG